MQIASNCESKEQPGGQPPIPNPEPVSSELARIISVGPGPQLGSHLVPPRGGVPTCVHKSADPLTLLPAPHTVEADFIFRSWVQLGDGEFCHRVGHH